MKNVAIITARGGSKRIPRKNIKNFFGKPIIGYSIEAAIKSEIFDYVMVSTDDQEIAEVAKEFGADIPFFRSEKTSDDYATTSDVIIEVINELKKHGKSFDNICCIYPTAPFLTDKVLCESFDRFESSKAYALVPVIQMSYSPQGFMKKNEDGFIDFVHPELKFVRSQDIPDIYYEVGQFYWMKTEEFLKSKSVIMDKTFGFEISELHTQDIDNQIDWELAEVKFEYLKKNNFNA